MAGDGLHALGAQARLDPTGVGNQLLVVNCSVGPADKNTYLYSVSDSGLTLESSINLIRDSARPQVFNFDGDLIEAGGTLHFVASTDEGLMWRGTANAGALEVDAVATVADTGGASLDVDDAATDRVVAAAHDVMLFEAP